MKKIVSLVFIFIILILGLAFIPYIDGYLFKHTYENIIASFNQINGVSHRPLKIDIVNYDLGWLHSKAKLRIQYDNENFKYYFNDDLFVDYDISHGPIIYNSQKKKYTIAFAGIDGKIRLPSYMQKILLGKNEQPIVETFTEITFDNQWKHQFTIPVLKLPLIGKLSISDSNYLTQFVVENGNINNYEFKGVSGSISLHADERNFNIPNVMIDPVDFVRTVHFQPLNAKNIETRISLPNTSIRWADGSSMVIKNFDYLANENISSDSNYHVSMNYQIKNASIPSKLIPNLSSFELEIDLHDFDQKGLRDWIDFIVAHSYQPFTEAESKHFVDLLSRATKENSIANIHLAFGSTLGSFSLKGWTNKIPDSLPPKNIFDLLNVYNFNIRFQIAIPMFNTFIESLFSQMKPEEKNEPNKINKKGKKTSVNNVQKMTDEWIKKGMLIKQGDDYVINVTTLNGILKINDKTLDEKKSND